MTCERCGARVHGDVRAGSCPRDCDRTLLPRGAWRELGEIVAGSAVLASLVIAASYVSIG